MYTGNKLFFAVFLCLHMHACIIYSLGAIEVSYGFTSDPLLSRFGSRDPSKAFPLLILPNSPRFRTRMAQAIVVGGGLAGVSAANTVLECGGKVPSTPGRLGVASSCTRMHDPKLGADSEVLFPEKHFIAKKTANSHPNTLLQPHRTRRHHMMCRWCWWTRAPFAVATAPKPPVASMGPRRKHRSRRRWRTGDP